MLEKALTVLEDVRLVDGRNAERTEGRMAEDVRVRRSNAATRADGWQENFMMEVSMSYIWPLGPSSTLQYRRRREVDPIIDIRQQGRKSYLPELARLELVTGVKRTFWALQADAKPRDMLD